MDKVKFIQHIGSHLHAFHENAQKVLHEGTEDDVHDLRVSIKKLRAVWSLVQLASQGSWKKRSCFDLVRKLFDDAGELRETQLNLKMTHQFGADHLIPYVEFLEEREKKAGKRLKKSLEAFDHRKFEELNLEMRKQLESLTDKTITEVSVAFIRKKTSQIQDLQRKLPDQKALHKIRIRLKAVQEVLDIILELGRNSLWESIHAHIKSLNHDLGEWHDDCVFNQSLGQFAKETSGMKIRPRLGELTGMLERRRKDREAILAKTLVGDILWNELAKLHTVIST